MNLSRIVERIARLVFRREIADVHTHAVAQVVSYAALTNTCSIQPCIRRIRSEDPNNLTTVQLPQIDDVPVMHRGSGKCLLTVAPQAGSYGVLHVSERSLDNWILSGGIVDPSSARKFDIGDGFFDPGAYPAMLDGNNGSLAVPVNTDRIELRDRLGTSYVAVTDAGVVELNAVAGNITMAIDGTITATNTLGTFSLDGVTGQFAANGNFTVEGGE